MKNSQKSSKPTWPLIITIILALISLGLIFWYAQTLNMVLGILTLPFIGGVVYFYSRWQMAGYSSVILAPGGKPTGSVNCLVISAIKHDNKVMPEKIAFENVDKPKGLLRRFPQIGNKWLPIMINIPEEIVEYNPFGANWQLDEADSSRLGDLNPFYLPDAAYCDPAQLAIAVNMEANNEYYKEEVSLFQQLRPWIMLAAIAIGGVILLAMG